MLCPPYIYAAFKTIDIERRVIERRYFQKVAISTLERLNVINPWWCRTCLDLASTPATESKYRIQIAYSTKPFSSAYWRDINVVVRNISGFAYLGLEFIESAIVTIDGIKHNGELKWV
jgi:hypothetical protein